MNGGEGLATATDSPWRGDSSMNGGEVQAFGASKRLVENPSMNGGEGLGLARAKLVGGKSKHERW